MADQRGISGKACGRLGNEKGAPVFVVSSGATSSAASSYDLIAKADFKFRVIDSWLVMTGAGASSDTVKLTDGTNDITDAVDLSSAGDTDRLAVGEIDDAYYTIDAGGTLKAVTASAATCIIYALCVRV